MSRAGNSSGKDRLVFVTRHLPAPLGAYQRCLPNQRKIKLIDRHGADGARTISVHRCASASSERRCAVRPPRDVYAAFTADRNTSTFDFSTLAWLDSVSAAPST